MKHYTCSCLPSNIVSLVHIHLSLGLCLSPLPLLPSFLYSLAIPFTILSTILFTILSTILSTILFAILSTVLFIPQVHLRHVVLRRRIERADVPVHRGVDPPRPTHAYHGMVHPLRVPYHQTRAAPSEEMPLPNVRRPLHTVVL